MPSYRQSSGLNLKIALLCRLCLLALAILIFTSGAVMAAEFEKAGQKKISANVAIAANFAPVIKELAALFEGESGHKIRVSTGSTGLLYAQITNGAPFDVFLAADQARPARLYHDGLSAGAPVTYALGRLALWSADAEVAPLKVLQDQTFRRLAIANPKLAPYGRAAAQTLEHMGIGEDISDRLVFGENIGQTFAFISLGHADIGFVARAQVLALSETGRGQYWPVPASSHAPIRQDMVLLTRAGDNAAARSFFEYLQTDRAKALIAKRGYDLPDRTLP